MKTLLACVCLIIISFGLIWAQTDIRKNPPLRTLFMLLIVFCGAVIGNLLLGAIDRIILKYVYISLLGGVIGGWIFYQIFRKLF
jgi:hypothetical protein